MNQQPAVLVIDDDEKVRTYLSDYLGSLNYRVSCAGGGKEALALLDRGPAPDVAILDVAMPEVDGFEVLRQYRDAGGRAPIIILSAAGEAEQVVKAMRLGATDYLTKPFENEELEMVLGRAVDRSFHGRPSPREPKRAGMESIYVSQPMQRVWDMVERIAPTDVPVLIRGESGVGKEVVARGIHTRSPRRAHPFVKINCAAVPSELLESELFGHERGAFTGATSDKPGKFELADRGTIFLDEIGEMHPSLQAKLLQILQDEEYYRVGGKRPLRVDARVVVATNRDLEKEIARGGFREDLYYRLNVVTVLVPPLRERKEDIPPLVEHFVAKYGKRYAQEGGAALSRLPEEMMDRFLAHSWPGNVRELENLVRRLVVLRDDKFVLEDLAASRSVPGGPPAPPKPADPEKQNLKEIARRAALRAEREAILAMLTRTGWNKRKAALRLQVSYKALLYKIKDCGIIDPRHQGSGGQGQE